MVAQQYVEEFGKLAKVNNTVIMPSDVSNVNQMVTQVSPKPKYYLSGL